MRLYLVRHGETVLNQKKCYYGMTDAPLSAVGEKQAREVADMVRNLHFDRVFASPLSRAQASARIIVSKDSGMIAPEDSGMIETDPRLAEQNFGIFEGMAYGEIQGRYPEELAAWNRDFDHYRIPGGESFTDVRKRAGAFVKDLQEMSRDRARTSSVLVVAHKGSLGHMMACLLELPVRGYWNFTFDQGAYSLVDLEDGYAIIRRLNSTKM